MEFHQTAKISLENCNGFRIDTYESGCIRCMDGDDAIEIYGVGLDKINSEIRGYVRSQGYSYDTKELERSSAFLSELQDEVAQALSRVQKELAEKAAA